MLSHKEISRMRKLQVMPRDNSVAKQELRRRIALSNRSRLNIGRERVEEVTSVLASNRSDRARFMDNPTSYLQEQSLPVSSCAFVRTAGRISATSELCAVFVASDCRIVSQIDQSACIMFLLDCVITSQIRALVIGVEVQDNIYSNNFDFEQGSAVL
jgi:hypothetical protein